MQPETTLPYPLEEMLQQHSVAISKTNYENLSRWRTYSKQHIQTLTEQKKQLIQQRISTFSISSLAITNELLNMNATAIEFNERFLQLITAEIDRRADMIPMEVILKEVAK